MITRSRTLTRQAFNPTLITNLFTPDNIRERLRANRCDGCSLGQQEGYIGPVIYRGNPESRRMIIGEAPGLTEDQGGIPFVGPAGKKLDAILASQDWTENDWYITNTIKCRPIAPPGSGKQNLTPTVGQRKACRPVIEQEIRWIEPYLVLLLGKSAVTSLLPKEAVNMSMQELAGRTIANRRYPNIAFYVMYHPAYLIHTQKDPEKNQEVRAKMWEDIQKLKVLDEELRSI